MQANVDDPGIMATCLVLSSAACVMPLLTLALVMFLTNSPIFLRYYFLGSLCETRQDISDELMSFILLLLDWLMATAGCEAMLFCMACISETLISVHLILKHLR